MRVIFEDTVYGLVLKGYSLVPNSALETAIAVYTPEITQSILSDHPEIVDGWLQKLHKEYIQKKKSCEFDNDSVACFNLATYEEFERHLKSWEDGGIIKIKLPTGSVISLSQKPLFTIAKGRSYLCDECGLSIPVTNTLSRHYMEKHPEMMEKIIIPN